VCLASRDLRCPMSPPPPPRKHVGNGPSFASNAMGKQQHEARNEHLEKEALLTQALMPCCNNRPRRPQSYRLPDLRTPRAFYCATAQPHKHSRDLYENRALPHFGKHWTNVPVQDIMKVCSGLVHRKWVAYRVSGSSSRRRAYPNSQHPEAIIIEITTGCLRKDLRFLSAEPNIIRAPGRWKKEYGGLYRT
jgi:hypothetical protein